MERTPLSFNVDFPPGIESFSGINVAWLHFETGSRVNHDGYGNGFDDYYFNGENGNTSLKAQLDTLRDGGVRTVRLWLNIYHYMNSDKETVGYTAFRSGFLTNLATYCDWCNARGIKMLICLDDCWYTFPWSWVNNTRKRATYIQACKDVVTALKDKPAVWGWDYCNEPYMGWAWSDVSSTIHWHNGKNNDVGYERKYLTEFFKELYTALKAIAPSHLFSVGSNYPATRGSRDLARWDIKSAVDFYQVHTYINNLNEFDWKASEFDKLVIVGETGYNRSNEYLKYPEFHKRLVIKMLQNGYGLILPWSLSQVLSRNNASSYSLSNTISQMKLWQG